MSNARQTDTVNLGGPLGPGAQLQKLRLERQWTLDDVAMSLNLSVAVLEALESGDYSSLPEWTFVRGYLRAYARLLGLAEESVIISLERPDSTPGDLGSVLPVMDGSAFKSKRKRIPSTDVVRKRVQRRRTLLIGVVIVLAVLAAWWMSGLRPSTIERVLNGSNTSETGSSSTKVQIPLDSNSADLKTAD